MLLEYKLPSLMDQHDIKLIIVDSVAALFRADYVPSQQASKAKLLRTIGAKLVNLSWKYSAAVVCVNQVSSDEHCSECWDQLFRYHQLFIMKMLIHHFCMFITVTPCCVVK